MLQFCMLIYKIQRKIFNINKFWVFFKICLWNLKFSYIFRLSPSCINVEKWKKFWVVYVRYRFIPEQFAVCSFEHWTVVTQIFHNVKKVRAHTFFLIFLVCKIPLFSFQKNMFTNTTIYCYDHLNLLQEKWTNY